MINRTAVICAALLAVPLAAQEPEIFVDKGACPGERCTYCTLYVAKKDIVLRTEPSESAEEVGVIKSGDALVAKTGEVHVVPARFNVYQAFEQFKPGDDVFLLTYVGEGYFKIRHNGVVSTGDFGFSPWSRSFKRGCDDRESCVGELNDDYEWTWWLYVTSETGLYGWVVQSEDLKYAEAF